jgi:hypothetical protein
MVAFVKDNFRLKLVLGMILFTSSIMLVKFLFPTFEYRTGPDLNRLYLAFHLWVVAIIALFELAVSNRKKAAFISK